MFSKIPEKRMHWNRWFLIVGWLILITSLFYDPISAYLTNPSSLLSPFRIRTPQSCAFFQNTCLPQIAYPMGARIFWGMVIPFAVVLLVAYGHEAWRRMCPLAFFSQIPRSLGWQRKRRVINPETNAVQYELALVDPGSWLGQNQLYFQCGLLFLGLNVRLWLVNSDRLMLGVFLALTLLCALTVGWLFGGKTWCQYFCPMAPVQMLYTGPRGLMGSEAHQTQRKGISQSMCRTVDGKGQEKSVCVSCQSPCLDIDAERAYWDNLNRPDRRVLYYGYLGLAIGFYLYFFLYSGNWNFLSGPVWLEQNQLATLRQPGFFIHWHTILIPKLVAVPLTLATFSGGTYGLGVLLERLYADNLRKQNKPVNIEQIRHRLFTIFTFLAFNSLYFLGVHPTLVWLAPFRPIPDWGVVIISSMWLYRTLGRSSDQYLRESLTQILRRQLSKLAINFRQLLGDRTLEDLKADEVYVLAKVLPGFSHEQRLNTYQEVLKEALENGNVNSSSSLEVLQQMREQLGISTQEHQTVLNELGITQPDLLDPQHQLSREQRLRLSSYRQALELLLLELVEQGMPLPEALLQKQTQIQILKQEYRISGEEDAQIVAEMSGQNSMLMRAASALLDQLQTLDQREQTLAQEFARTQATVFDFLRADVDNHQRVVSKQLLSILEILGDQSETRQMAIVVNTLAHPIVQGLLQDPGSGWEDRLSPNILKLLKAPARSGDRPLPSGHRATTVEILREFMVEPDAIIQSASLFALDQIEPQQAAHQAKALQAQGGHQDDLLQDTIAQILTRPQPSVQNRAQEIVALNIDIRASGRAEHRVFKQPVLRIGRDPSNDIVFNDNQVSRNHAILRFDQTGVTIEDLGSAAGTRVDGKLIRSRQESLSRGDQILFTTDLVTGLTVSWDTFPIPLDPTNQESGTLAKVLILFEINLFRQLEPPQLLHLAQASDLRVYPSGSVLCRQDEPARELLILTQGDADAFVERDQEKQWVGKITRGETIGGLGMLSASTRSTTVIAAEDTQVLSIQADRLEALLGQDALMAMQLLRMVSDRLQNALDQLSDVNGTQHLK